MSKATTLCTILLLSLGLSGCMTIANLKCKDRAEWGAFPFGGVTRDAYVGVAGAPLVLPALLALADLPLSFFGDLVTLPWIVSWCREQHERDEKLARDERRARDAQAAKLSCEDVAGIHSAGCGARRP